MALFGRVAKQHIFSFKITLHAFLYTFSPTHISKNYKQYY